VFIVEWIIFEIVLDIFHVLLGTVFTKDRKAFGKARPCCGYCIAGCILNYLESY